MTNITFICQTSPITKPKEKKRGGTWHIISTPSEKVVEHVPHVPHQIASMVMVMFEWRLFARLCGLNLNCPGASTPFVASSRVLLSSLPVGRQK